MPAPYIFILGTGHSGGTLLNLLLGASPQVFAAGESLHLWNLANLDRQDDRTRAFWRQAQERLCSFGWPDERLTRADVRSADIDLWRQWITIVSDISSQPVVADKSNHLQIVRKICDAKLVKPFFVHLIRDARAVAHSYARTNKLDFSKARSWQISNMGIARFLDGRDDAMFLRYEDLVADPWHHAVRILQQAGKCFDLDLAADLPSDLKDRSLDDAIFDNVMYGGNVMRRPGRRAGRTIAPDDRYLGKMSKMEWGSATLLNFRGLRKFGYPVGRQAMRRMLMQS